MSSLGAQEALRSLSLEFPKGISSYLAKGGSRLGRLSLRGQDKKAASGNTTLYRAYARKKSSLDHKVYASHSDPRLFFPWPLPGLQIAMNQPPRVPDGPRSISQRHAGDDGCLIMELVHP